MKRKRKQKNAAVKRFVSRNKLFVIIAAVLCLSLIGSGIRTHSNADHAEETAVQSEVTQDELHWRFYPIDLWVLGVGGGFCTVMILREKRKARETLI